MVSSALESAESWISFFWWFKLVAAGLVALGVGMEFAGDWLSKPFEKTIEDARRLELVTLKNANLVLEAKLQPRRIDDAKQSEIAKSLEKFSGKVVKLESYVLDAEAAILGKQIGAALSAAKLRVDSGLMTRQTSGSIAFAVHVTGPNAALVKALLASLSKAGIETSPDDPNPPIGGVQTTITFGAIRSAPADASVFVGIKPIK